MEVGSHSQGMVGGRQAAGHQVPALGHKDMGMEDTELEGNPVGKHVEDMLLQLGDSFVDSAGKTTVEEVLLILMERGCQAVMRDLNKVVEWLEDKVRAAQEQDIAAVLKVHQEQKLRMLLWTVEQ